jgi:integrase/recombinase XerD
VGNELVKASSGVPVTGHASAALPELLELAGGAARFACDEFFYAKHHWPLPWTWS